MIDDMTKWKLNPAIRRAASFGPATFAQVALPIIERFGEEAKKIIRDTQYKAGYEKGQCLAKKAKDRDSLLEFERILVDSMIQSGANTPGFDDPARKWVVKTKKKCSYNTSLCGGCEVNTPQVWKSMGLDAKTIKMLADLYCVPYDRGVREGFNPKIKFNFTKLATYGDPYCEWYEEIE
jgi:hypothetical protein